MQHHKQPIAMYTRTVAGEESLRPGDVLKILTVNHGVIQVKGRTRRPMEDAARLVVAFLGGAAVSLSLSFLLSLL